MGGSGIEVEEAIIDFLRQFVGKSSSEIEAILKEHLNPQSKGYFRSLADRMLKSSPDLYYALITSGTYIRTVRVKDDSPPKESMSFPAFDFEEMTNSSWQQSEFYKQITSRFLFLVFTSSDDSEDGDFSFKNAAFWSMPDDDLQKAEFVWNDTRQKIVDGNIDAFIPKTANLMVHVRPHGQNAAERKYSFWLNNDYVGKVISSLPVIQPPSSTGNKEAPKTLEQNIIGVLSEADGPVVAFKLKKNLDSKLMFNESYDRVIASLLERGVVERTSNGLSLRVLTVHKMVEKAPENVRDYFALDSEAFESRYKDVDDELLRIRAYFSARPKEDELASDFSLYKFKAKQFMDLYSVDEETYRYLELMHPKGWKEPEDLLNDPTKTDTFKRKLRAMMYNNIELEDGKLNLSDDSIIAYVLSKIGKPKHISEVSRLCKEFVNKNCLKNAPLCKMNSADIKLCSDKPGTHVLRLDSTTVRYYPFDEKQVTEFLKRLDLGRYSDSYISAQLIIIDSKAICDEYDIRNEQEMYMLLSKYKHNSILTSLNMVLPTSPSVCFGQATIPDQITALLQETGRINKNDFCRMYSERYGMKEQSIRSLMTKFSQYSNGDYFDMNLPKFSDEVIEYLSTMMSPPRIMSHDVARKLFFKAESKFDIKSDDKSTHKTKNDPYYNIDNLNRLGYRSAQGSIYPDAYQSLREAVDKELFSKDFVTITDEMRDNKSVMNIFNDYLESRRYYLIEGDTYVTADKLYGAGVTDDMIADYQSAAASFLEPDSYFTLDFLHNCGFQHELEEQGFEDEFYENILCLSRNLRCGEIHKHKVFTSMEKFNRNGAIVDMTLTALGNDDSDYEIDIVDKIDELYGLNLGRELRNEHKPLRYCKYTEKIFRDDQAYVDEMTGA
ncbi:hypothetical protein PED39_02505 [Methanomassiliicoccales archaeon LGM-RCC1]|nr:hypothetical protein PED39_02505 [Methanomassiliicoccales archaeon LGM-RCC1]